MFELQKTETKAEIRGLDEFNSIRRGMRSKGYLATLGTMEDAISDVLGIAHGRLQLGTILSERAYRTMGTAAMGELFFKSDSAFLVAPVLSKLAVWEIRPHNTPSQIAEFHEAIESVVRAKLDGRRVRGMEFSWKTNVGAAVGVSRLRRRPRRPPLPRLETTRPEYSPGEFEGAKLIKQAKEREFLINLAKVGNKARSADADSLIDIESRSALTSAGIIRKEYLLVCRKDSRTICSIPDKTELEATIGGKLTCTSCGRHFTDELIQDIYALTTDGRRLLAGSHWMTIWITSLLSDAGISRDVIKWNAAAGDDEVDIIADIHGLRVFFELKDREFGLGDAYPFSFRLERYGGEVGVVITMVSVADEAQRFLEEQRRRGNATLKVLEGESAISSGIGRLVRELSKLAVSRSVAGAEEHLGFDIWPLLESWMSKYE